MCLYAVVRSEPSTSTSSFEYATWIPVLMALGIGCSLAYVSLFGNTPQMIDQRKRNERSKELLNKFGWVLKFSVLAVVASGLVLTGHALIFILIIPVLAILIFVIHLERSRRAIWRNVRNGQSVSSSSSSSSSSK